MNHISFYLCFRIVIHQHTDASLTQIYLDACQDYDKHACTHILIQLTHLYYPIEIFFHQYQIQIIQFIFSR